MRIPKTFRVAHRTWRVRVRKLKHKDGETNFRKCVVTLNSDLPEFDRVQTFIHELLHVTSHAMNWDRVNHDERRLDTLANLLTQAIQTRKGSI